MRGGRRRPFGIFPKIDPNGSMARPLQKILLNIQKTKRKKTVKTFCSGGHFWQLEIWGVAFVDDQLSEMWHQTNFSKV